MEAGADEAIDNAPVNRFAPFDEISVEQAPLTNALAQPSRRPSPKLIAQNTLESTASELALSATTVEDLARKFASFDGCDLKLTANNFVFADGNSDARVMFIGEAPGAEEDRQGLPFVGPAGRLLDLMLAAIDLDRSDVYITNILPWRPPGNRNPTDAEATVCLPFVQRHIELVQPQVLITVGGTAAKALLNTREGIMKLRGRWLTYATPRMKVVPTRAILHPAYLLRSPAQKRDTWRDLIAIKRRLDEDCDVAT